MLKKIKDIMGKKEKTVSENTEKLQDEALANEGEGLENATDSADSTQNMEEEADQNAVYQREITELKDKNLRLRAEFDNFKRRTMREKIDLMNTAAQDTLTALLPVLDDFDRAKQNAEDENSKEPFSEGVNLVYNKLQNVLKQKGLKSMESTGGVFDPELHEAITEIPAPSEDLKGKIIDTIETGYFLNDKLIRHAKVVVGK